MTRTVHHERHNPLDVDFLRLADDTFSRRQAEVAMLLGDYMRTREGPAFDEAKAREVIRLAIQILGGEPATADQFPDCCIVGQTLRDGIRWFASGVLVAPNRVATARHISSAGRVPDVVALPTDGVGIDSAVIMPGRFTPHGPADLAVMELEEAVRVAPIDLASSADLEAATVTTVVGFGSNRIGPVLMDRKRHADLDIDIASRTDTEFTAGRGGKGACEGDSGGPAYIEVNGRLMLAGITSRPENPGGMCGDRAIFVRADVHRNFILGL